MVATGLIRAACVIPLSLNACATVKVFVSHTVTCPSILPEMNRPVSNGYHWTQLTANSRWELEERREKRERGGGHRQQDARPCSPTEFPHEFLHEFLPGPLTSSFGAALSHGSLAC